MAENEKTSLTEDTDKRTAAHTFESRTVDSDIEQSEAWPVQLDAMVTMMAQAMAGKDAGK